MQQLSEKLLEELPDKPQPDHFQSWFALGQTQYHLACIKVRHQQTLEELAELCVNDCEAEYAEYNKLKATALVLEEVIDEIEGYGHEV